MARIQAEISDVDRDEIRTVLRLLADIVEEMGPDYVYPGAKEDRCLYVVDNRPSCLAARVLVRLGVSVRSLAQREGDSLANFSFKDSRLHAAARQILERVQLQQDARRPWGYVLEQAKSWASDWYGITNE